MTSSESTVTKETWREGVKWDWYARWGWCQPQSLILYIFLFPHITPIMDNCIEIFECYYFVYCPWLVKIAGRISAIWFGWYCPYWRECVTVLGMYICTSVWLIRILCQNNVSDWEDFTPAAMMVVFSWGREGIACGVWVLQRWGNI